jgi:lipopolysaccharide/colanic/teichoic acid biosynthesis glycosyltransferase
MSPVSASLPVKPRQKAAPQWPELRPAIDLEPSPYFRWKGLLDRTAAALLLVPAAPLIGLLVLLVKLTSRGPGIYSQVRVGLRGRLFTMHKIRTMRADAEATVGPVWTQAGDPRITLVGRFLRKLHLDELPQLFNVVKGEMAIIGPRPERPEFVEVLRDALPGYMNRLAVRPGVTGLSQLNLPPDTDLDSVHRKLILDCQYIERAGLWLDFRLFLATCGRMFKVPCIRLLGIHRDAALPPAPIAGPSLPHAPHDLLPAGGTGPHVSPRTISRQRPSRNNGKANGKAKHHRPR